MRVFKSHLRGTFRVEGGRRLIHGVCEGHVKLCRFVGHSEFIASLGVKELILGAALSDAGVLVAEFRISADTRYQCSMR